MILSTICHNFSPRLVCGLGKVCETLVALERCARLVALERCARLVTLERPAEGFEGFDGFEGGPA